MGACSGKEADKGYAGYSPARNTSRGTCKEKEHAGHTPTVRRAKTKSSNPSKQVSPKVTNLHGFTIDSATIQELKANELSALLKLMNHESKDISTYAYEIITGLSINGFTGAVTVSPQAVKNLNTLIGCDLDGVLISCITVLHTLVQQDEDLTTEIYIACISNLIPILRRNAADILCGAISLLGLMAAVDDILCDMIDKNVHETLADKFHSTNDVVVKRQIFLALHNFMLIKNSEKAMHTKVIQTLIETLQLEDDIIDPDIRKSALRIMSYISMSGSEYLQKMIAELGGIPTLARHVRITEHSRKNSAAKELTKIAGMALSGLCCVESLQTQILAEWGLEAMLQSFETNTSDVSATLAIIMALNNMLSNVTLKPVLVAHPSLKQLLRSVQQKTTNEDILEECTEALCHLLPSDHKQAQLSKFEKLCMQHFSPFAPVMRRKNATNNRLLPSMIPTARPPSTTNWLLSPEHITLSPRRQLFPRKLVLFSPKRPSPTISPRRAISPRRHSISIDSAYSVTTPPQRSYKRRKSVPAYSASPRNHTQRNKSSRPSPSSYTKQKNIKRVRAYASPDPQTLIITEASSSRPAPSTKAQSPYNFTSPCDSSFIFCSPIQSPAWASSSASSPYPTRPANPSPRFTHRPPTTTASC